MKVKITSVDSILCMPWHRWLVVSLSLEFWVQFQANSSGMCGRQSGSGTDFSPNISVFMPVIIPPMVHTHSLIPHIIECWQFTAILTLLRWIQECT